MRPVAYILIHPTKLSTVESILYTKAMYPAVEITTMQEMLAALNARGLFGAEYAEAMAAMWSAVNHAPSWRLRSILDRYEGLQDNLQKYGVQLVKDIAAGKNLLCMATPGLVNMLIQNGYTLVFFETDTTYMSNEEIKVCYPRHMEGVCGEWIKHPDVKRSDLGLVVEGISIPA